MFDEEHLSTYDRLFRQLYMKEDTICIALTKHVFEQALKRKIEGDVTKQSLLDLQAWIKAVLSPNVSWNNLSNWIDKNKQNFNRTVPLNMTLDSYQMKDDKMWTLRYRVSISKDFDAILAFRFLED